MSDPLLTKKNLLDKIFAERNELEGALAAVPEQKMSAPILHDGWSVQDMLGHLLFWEEWAVARLAILRAGQSPKPITDIDAFNAQILAEFRPMALTEIRRREQEAYRQIIALIESANEAELFDPAHFSANNGHPFAESIENNSWGHYQEHLPELQTWLKENSPA